MGRKYRRFVRRTRRKFKRNGLTYIGGLLMVFGLVVLAVIVFSQLIAAGLL